MRHSHAKRVLPRSAQVVILLMLAACATPVSIAEDQPIAAPTTVVAVAPTPTPTPLACQKVVDALGQAITKKSKYNIEMKFVRGQSLRSPEVVGMNFIAVEFTAPGIGNHVSVFASTSLTGTATVMAADEMAKVFTDWPDVSKTNPTLTSDHPALGKAVECLA